MRKISRMTLAHGAGGILSHRLLKEMIIPALGNPCLAPLGDASTVKLPDGEKLLITTDSFVVDPIFFPGGDIGKLSVCGSVNDIVVSGGRPVCVSLAMIIEEGFPFDGLEKILLSVKEAASDAGVYVAAGDTKVVPKGACGGIFINTTAIGMPCAGLSLGRGRIREGDAVIVTGTMAEHGFAILSARNGLMLDASIMSDCASLHEIIGVAGKFAGEIRFMRDPTRGGLAAVLNEIVEEMPFGISLDQDSIPLSPAVKALSEMLGIDPLSVASEGRAVVVCSKESAAELLADLRETGVAAGSKSIGEASGRAGKVHLRTIAGAHRMLDMPAGEIVPRIC